MQFTDNEIAEKLTKVRDLLDGGMNVGEALKQLEISPGNYYNWIKKPKKRAPRLQTIQSEPSQPQEKVVCIIGSPEDIANVIRGMR